MCTLVVVSWCNQDSNYIKLMLPWTKKPAPNTRKLLKIIFVFFPFFGFRFVHTQFNFTVFYSCTSNRTKRVDCIDLILFFFFQFSFILHQHWIFLNRRSWLFNLNFSKKQKKTFSNLFNGCTCAVVQTQIFKLLNFDFFQKNHEWQEIEICLFKLQIDWKMQNAEKFQ